MTYRAIAQQLGISAQAAHKAVKKAMDALKAHVYTDADTIRTMGLEKLDAVEMGMWPGVSKGNHNAANAVIKSIETRAKILGLNAPDKHANTDSQGNDICSNCQRLREMSDEELQARLKELREDLCNDTPHDP